MILHRRLLRLVVGTSLIIVSGCGQGSQSPLRAAQVQKAFVHEGLHTRILVDCTAGKPSLLDTGRCPLGALVAPHATAVVGDFRETVRAANGSAPIEAYLFDSARAADAFEFPETFINSEGKSLRPFIRLQRRNVVVSVARRSAYKRRAEAALATLG